MGELSDSISEWDTIKYAASKQEISPTLDIQKFDVDKLTLVLMGDTHIGSRYYDEARHKRDIKWCVDNKAPIILMGDNLECATRDSVGAGVYEQDEIIDEQVERWLKIYEPAFKAGLILGTHDGNHEARLFKSSGFHLTKHMAKMAGIAYFGWSKFHRILVGKQAYTLYTTHGGSGARMPHTKIKAAIDLGNIAEADIYAMGHVHQLSHHTRKRYVVNLKQKTIDEKEIHYIITGAYLRHWGSYAHIKGMEPVKIGAAKLKLNGLEREVRVSV